VKTVDESMGLQFDIVLILLTRANEGADLGFLKEQARLIVMLSRARFAEIVIGHGDTMVRVSVNLRWTLLNATQTK